MAALVLTLAACRASPVMCGPCAPPKSLHIANLEILPEQALLEVCLPDLPCQRTRPDDISTVILAVADEVSAKTTDGWPVRAVATWRNLTYTADAELEYVDRSDETCGCSISSAELVFRRA